MFAPHIAGSSVAIVTNSTVDPLYGDALRRALAPLGKKVTTVVLPDGEAHKNWETLNRIFDALLTERADRKTTLIALGGGVVGDMTGFRRRLLHARRAVRPGADHACWRRSIRRSAARPASTIRSART